MKKAILFDFDGTVIDTNDVIIESWQHTFLHYRGERVPQSEITAIFGEQLADSMARLFPEVPAEEAASVYRSYQQNNADRLVKGFAGMKEALNALRGKGFALAVVTSRARESTERYLRLIGLESAFSCVVTCDDTTAHKPDPAPIFCALERLGVEAKDAVMVGDSPYDMACANNAGVTSVMVGWRVTGDEAAGISRWTADYEADTPEELVALLCKI